MNIQLSIRHMNISESLKGLIHELCNEVAALDSGIRQMEVTLDDVNGPHKAGIDKCCHLHLRGDDHLVIDIQEMDRELTYAIDQAFARLRQQVQRRKKGKLRVRGDRHTQAHGCIPKCASFAHADKC